MSDVLKDRQEEEHFFRNARDTDLPVEVIRKLQVHLDADGDLVFFFENAQRLYALCVVLSNHSRLGWKECQAINDVMKIASRGTDINNEDFKKLVEQLKSKYGKVQDPNVQNGRLTAVVFPGPGSPIRADKPHTILHTSISFDNDGDLIFAAKTNEDRLYRVCLELTLSENHFLNLDCKAFVDILIMLEAGDKLSPDQFFACGAILRKKYNFVTPSISSNSHRLTMTVLASRVPNTKPQHHLFEQAVADISARNQHEQQQQQQQQQQPTHQQQQQQPPPQNHLIPQHPNGSPPIVPNVPPCPYPGIVYTATIKEGGQGQVYAGRRGDEDVAIKVFLDQEGAAEAYKTELRMLLKMSRHRNIVEVLDFFEIPSPALVMKLIDGEDLMDYLRAHGAVSEAEGRTLVVGIAEGLCHLHRHGIIHRDFKSANILRQLDGTPVIIDLGFGSMLNRSSDRPSSSLSMNELIQTLSATHISQRTSTLRGSFPWMAPEMIREQEWSDKTDVYAFGIIMWEIFSGQTPFVRPGEEVNPMSLLWRIASGERPPMAPVSHVSPELRQLMELCWHDVPRSRPRMKRVLDILLGNDPRRIFKDIDKDDSGGLDFGEFVTFLLRYAPGRVAVDDMSSLFHAIDDDENGSIGISEFERFWREVEVSGLRNVVQNSKSTKKIRARDAGR